MQLDEPALVSDSLRLPKSELLDFAAKAYERLGGLTARPQILLTTPFGGERCAKAMRWLMEHGIPAYDDPDRAVAAIGGLRKYGRLLAEKAANSTVDEINVDRAAVKALLDGARKDGRKALTEVEAKKLFSL